MSGTLSATTLASLAPYLQSATQIASLGSTGYNLYNQYQNQQYQNQLRSYAQDPAKMNAYAAQFTQPLTAGLTAGVANQAQGYLASRGLSDSPQISQQVEAQAIAPYIQQNQQQGYQDALQALQVGGGAIPPQLQQQQSLAALAKAFSQWGGGGGGANPLAKLLQLTQAAPTPPIQTPDMGDQSIPYQPAQTFDFSSWQPDYSMAGGAGGGDTGAGGGGGGD
jgi:hypothetical protein